MATAKIAADRGSPALEQQALSDLITRGEFDRHLRRMRPVYRRRRDALLAALARRLPWLEPSVISAGVHLVTSLPPHLDETTVVEAAPRAGVGIDAVGPYRIASPGPGGLILGYATVSEQALAEGVDTQARVSSSRRPARTGLAGRLDLGAPVRLRDRPGLHDAPTRIIGGKFRRAHAGRERAAGRSRRPLIGNGRWPAVSAADSVARKSPRSA